MTERLIMPDHHEERARSGISMRSEFFTDGTKVVKVTFPSDAADEPPSMVCFEPDGTAIDYPDVGRYPYTEGLVNRILDLE